MSLIKQMLQVVTEAQKLQLRDVEANPVVVLDLDLGSYLYEFLKFREGWEDGSSTFPISTHLSLA